MSFFTYLHSLNLWLHLISLALWIGAIVFFLFVVGPAAHTLSPGAGVRVLDRARSSFQALSWIAATLLLITGILNLVFRGMGSGLQLGAGYYSILAIKLLLYLAMVFHHFLQAFKYAPQIASLTAQAGPEIEARFDSAHRAELVEAWPEPLLGLWKKWFLLLKINATLGPVVLLLGLGLTRS